MTRTARVRHAVRKTVWGARQVGGFRVIRGLLWLALLRIRRPQTVRCLTRNGMQVRFRYPSQLMPSLIVFGDLLEPELGLLPQFVHDGTVAIDVGSSIGTWTMAAARSGARVIACEPDPAGLETLRANCLTNGLADRVTVRQLGLGDAGGRGRLLRQRTGYANRVRPRREPADGDGGLGRTGGNDVTEPEIAITTLDALAEAEGLDHLDVVKVNTAGGEREVLEGGLELLRRRAVGLLLVLDGLEVRPLLDKVRGFGYEMGIWDGTAQRLIPVATSALLDAAPRGPMTRYVILVRCEP